MLILFTTIVLASAAPVAPASCDAFQPVRQHFMEMRQAILNGEAEDDGDSPDIVEPMRACFRTQVMPELTRAETDHTRIDQASSDFLAWGRQVALLEIDELDAEFSEGLASMVKGLKHAYAVARDKCVEGRDWTQMRVMLRLARNAELFGFEITDQLGKDIQACASGWAFMVEVDLSTTTSNYGETSRFRYTAMLRADPESEGDLIGTGVYGGFITGRKANCRNDAPDEAQRFIVSGELEASGAMIDMSFGGEPDPHLLYVLGTKDWDLRPMWGGDGPFAESDEEREGLKGMGTTASFRPIKLTDRVTTSSTTTRSGEDDCAGVRTQTTNVRIEQL